jgi:protein SCO1/2
MSRNAALWGVALAAVLAGLVTYLFARPDVGSRDVPPDVPGFAATAANLNPADISFVDQDGVSRTFRDYRGRVVAVFFGFARCPDVCPTRLFELSQLMEQLGSDRDRVQVLFVTLDPERDTPGLLKSYLAAFDPSFAGATGTPAQMEALAKRFYVAYRRVPVGDDYTIDHSAATYLIDPAGERLYVGGSGTSPAQLVEGIRLLLGSPD